GRLPRPARAGAALRHRKGRRRQDHRRCVPRAARRTAGQADAGWRGRRQGQPGRLLLGRADHLQAAPGATQPLRHVHGHRGVAEGVPHPSAEAAADGQDRPALAHLRVRGHGCARRQRGADHRQVPLGDPPAQLRPGDRRCGRQRSRDRPAGCASGDQGAGQRGPHPVPDQLDDRHPLRRRPHRAGDRLHSRGDAGQRDDRSQRAGAHRDKRRPGRGRGEPGAPRAVRAGRGGRVRAPLRRGPPQGAGGRAGRRGRGRARGGPAGRHPASHPGRAPRAPPHRDGRRRPAALRARAVRPLPRPAVDPAGGRGARRGARVL
ncbi:MAG: Arsenical pump-driving ATPase, partial [uncultured Acidimicrobiales bacterium]